MEKEAKEEKQKEPGASKEKQQKEEKDIDLTRPGHERALNGTYRSFVMDGTPKTDIDSYFEQVQPHIKTLIEEQLKEI